MDMLRRILGAGGTDRTGPGEPPGEPQASGAPETSAGLDALERDRDLELMREDQERLDELQQRQLRYASYAWEPPRQGGELRAEDNDPPRS